MIALITGIAGFIGSNLSDHLLSLNHKVIGIDNYDKFYDKSVKFNNISNSFNSSSFVFYEVDILNYSKLSEIISKEKPDVVIHLAAKAGVRPSIKDPKGYFNVNVNGTLNILEAMRYSNVKKMIFASSSSVYGNCRMVPFNEEMNVDNPISPYAASKKAGELLCHAYHHLHAMDIFCLRFFTVYGPRQRPDLAIHKFTKSIIEETEMPFYGDGTTRRDYTHINDIVHGIEKSIDSLKGYGIFNLGESHTTSLEELVTILERAIGKKANKKLFPMQEGDVLQTYADILKARQILGYAPTVKFEEGVFEYVKWFKDTHGV
jgi:UDP-glucuronate 4-epimerase